VTGRTERSDVLRILLEQLSGWDVNLATEDGWTPLHMATSRLRYDMMVMLLTADANPWARLKKTGLMPADLVPDIKTRPVAYPLLRDKERLMRLRGLTPSVFVPPVEPEPVPAPTSANKRPSPAAELKAMKKQKQKH